MNSDIGNQDGKRPSRSVSEVERPSLAQIIAKHNAAHPTKKLEIVVPQEQDGRVKTTFLAGDADIIEAVGRDLEAYFSPAIPNPARKKSIPSNFYPAETVADTQNGSLWIRIYVEEATPTEAQILRQLQGALSRFMHRSSLAVLQCFSDGGTFSTVAGMKATPYAVRHSLTKVSPVIKPSCIICQKHTAQAIS